MTGDRDDGREPSPVAVLSPERSPHQPERGKTRTRRALVDASANLFHEKGYAATTVADIAERAGCSRRTFFRYFSSKEDVVFANAGDLISEFQRAIDQPTFGLTRWAQIRLSIASTMLQVAAPSSGIGDIAVATWLCEPALTKRFSQLTAELERCIVCVLAAERGVHPDSDLATQFMARCATAGYMTALHIHMKTERDLAALLEQVNRLLEEETYACDRAHLKSALLLIESDRPGRPAD